MLSCRPDPLSELFDSFLQRSTETYAKFETPGRIGQRYKDRDRERAAREGTTPGKESVLAGSLPKHPIVGL